MLVSVTRVKFNFRFSTYNLRILLEPLRTCILLGDTSLQMRIYMNEPLLFSCKLLKLLLLDMVAASQRLLNGILSLFSQDKVILYHVTFSDVLGMELDTARKNLDCDYLLMLLLSDFHRCRWLKILCLLSVDRNHCR